MVDAFVGIFVEISEKGVNTMTDKTVTFSVRVPKEIKDDLTFLNRKTLENISRQIKSGEIRVSDNGVEVLGTSCDGCPYLGVNLDKLYEVCEMKNLDPQKALDRCVQMLWR